MSHKQSNKMKLKQMNVDSCVIPGGTTKFLQPADVVWNSAFKAKVESKTNLIKKL